MEHEKIFLYFWTFLVAILTTFIFLRNKNYVYPLLIGNNNDNLVFSGNSKQYLYLNKENLKVSQVFWTHSSTTSGFTLRFTVEDKRGCRPLPRFYVQLDHNVFEVANWEQCLSSHDSNKYHWNYFKVQIERLPRKTYQIGHLELASPSNNIMFNNSVNNTKIVFLGDTGDTNRQLKRLSQNMQGVKAVVHLGDLSYASNTGNCYNPSNRKDCVWYLRGTHRNLRLRTVNFDKWKKFFDDMDPISKTTLFFTTVGNHDNDPQFFAKFGEMSQFRKVTLGDVRLVSLITEDNLNDPYERARKVIQKRFDTEEQQLRFDAHFGKDSSQLNWLKEQVSPSKLTTIAFSHRPLLHSSGHHPSCSIGGDWYGCIFKDTYLPELYRIHADWYISGHSHHYEKGVIEGKLNYIVAGIGGMKLDKAGRNQNPPPQITSIEDFKDDVYGWVEFENKRFTLV